MDNMIFTALRQIPRLRALIFLTPFTLTAFGGGGSSSDSDGGTSVQETTATGGTLTTGGLVDVPGNTDGLEHNGWHW